MIKDKYSAVWVSHSSMSDYLKCPRAYYLNNVYRNPKTNHKITLMQPALALGQAVHEVVESLSKLPVEERLAIPLTERYERVWVKVSGKRGGFRDPNQETEMKNRGLTMIKRVMDHPGPILEKAIKIRQDLPYYWLSEEENIILCGKIDWLQYIESNDSVRIIDFKTGKFDEDPDSLQLPIYLLLTSHTQSKNVSGVSYWYLDRDDTPVSLPLPDAIIAEKKILDIAKKIALARKLDHFKCQFKDGCRACRPLEAIVAGKAEFVGVNDFGQDMYILGSS
jgi:ATP-dependent helicase/DNAse subunit B